MRSLTIPAMPTKAPAEVEKERNLFGTFGGVFTPSILTILGVIMFLRAGFVVGQAGIREALYILLACQGIVVLTAISISAIATNTRVKGGGAYFLISRALGPEFGGSVGLALFIAQAVSIPFYILGFAEALVETIPTLSPWFAHIALSTALVLFLVNLVGANWAIKVQYIVMAVLALSIIIFIGGAWTHFEQARFEQNWDPAYTEGMGFWVVFAIYFPAVTGIMTGVNMSGDLKDPSRSLVRGTFAAILVGGLVYGLQILITGGAQERVDMVERPYETLLVQSLFGASFLVAAGVFSATLSSALGSFMGAPRVLQALARDRIFRSLRFFAHGRREPRRALVLTMLITLGVITAASGENARESFNVVASLVAMFFLCTYCIVNVAAFVESFGANPSFRPKFRLYHWSTALLGAIGCIGAMILINLKVALIAGVMILILYVVISRRVARSRFGDARRGFVYSAVVKNLLRLQNMPYHPKNWRPTIMILSGVPEDRPAVVQYGVWLEGGMGIVSLVQLISGKLEDMQERRVSAMERLKKFIEEEDLKVFPEVLVSPAFDQGIRMTLQSHSIGPIKPNMVINGWPRDPERILPFVRHLRDVALLGKSSVLVIDRGLPADYGPKRIDVWWRGKENGSLMLILAYLLTRNWEWNRAKIRVIREVEQEAGIEPAKKALDELVQAARIEAESVVLVSGESFTEVLHKQSSDATVVFLGYVPPEEEDAEGFFNRTNELTANLPTCILVKSSGEADLLA